MARKVKSKLDPADSVTDKAGQQPLEPPKRKRGRPTKEETEARKAAEEQTKKEEAAKAFPEEQARGTVAVMLAMMAKGINGEPPTREEIEMCTPPTQAVAIKYGFTLDKYPEFALVGALVMVGVQMRQRRKDKTDREEKLRPRDTGPKGERQEPPSKIVPTPTIAGGGV